MWRKNRYEIGLIMLVLGFFLLSTSASGAINENTQSQQIYAQQQGVGLTLIANQDAYISQWAMGSTVGCTKEFLRVDPGPILTKNRAVVEFPLDEIPSDAHIEDAKLGLYYYNYIENNPAGDRVFVQETDDYDWEDGDVSWKYWDKSEGEKWDLLWITEYCHMRRPSVYPELIDSTIADTVMPDEFGWVYFTDESEDGGIGMTASVQALVDGSRANYGWMISGHESDGKTNAFDFYSSRYSDSDYHPKLIVHYVVPPDIDEVLYITGITEDSVTLHSAVNNTGCQHATANSINYGVDRFFFVKRISAGAHYPFYLGQQTSPGPFNLSLDDALTPGAVYNVYAEIMNSAGYDSIFSSDDLPGGLFLSKPLSPSNLNAIADFNSIYLTWDKATTYDETIANTKILAKEISEGFPTDPEDQTAIKIYNGTGTSVSKQLEPNTTYAIRAWTYCYINSLDTPLSGWSLQYVDIICTTGIDSLLTILPRQKILSGPIILPELIVKNIKKIEKIEEVAITEQASSGASSSSSTEQIGIVGTEVESTDDATTETIGAEDAPTSISVDDQSSTTIDTSSGGGSASPEVSDTTEDSSSSTTSDTSAGESSSGGSDAPSDQDSGSSELSAPSEPSLTLGR